MARILHDPGHDHLSPATCGKIVKHLRSLVDAARVFGRKPRARALIKTPGRAVSLRAGLIYVCFRCYRFYDHAMECADGNAYAMQFAGWVRVRVRVRVCAYAQR